MLLWSLVEVHSQTVPYVSFMNEPLPNNSYVDLTLVGEDTGDPGNTVRCHTDLSTCCSGGQGSHRGDWYFPNGTRLLFGISDNRSDVEMNKLTCFVGTMLTHHLVYIAVIFQLMLSIRKMTPQ